MTILVSLFNTKTKQEFLVSSRSFLGSFHKIHKFKKDDIVLLLDIEAKCLFAITLLDCYENGDVFKDHHLLDIDIYSGDKSHYNKYEIKIQKVTEVNIPFKDLAILCGKCEHDKTRTNIWKGSQMNFCSAMYVGEDSEDVLNRLQILVNSLLSVK